MANSFQEAIERRKKMEKEKEAAKNKPKGSGNFEYEEFNYLGLEAGIQAGFRIIGNPVETREKPTDPKVVLFSNVLNEAGNGYVKIHWAYKEKDGDYIPDPNWILTKLYNKVAEGKWKKYDVPVFSEEKGKEVTGEYENYHKHTKIFQKLKTKFGNSKEGEMYPKNFYPSTRIVMNVIDRSDDFCSDNKHSKLLSSKVSVNKNDPSILYPDTGIPYSLYVKMFDTYAGFGGDWNKCDALITKKEKAYDVFSADETKRIAVNLKGKVIDGDLTEEEKQYELYDLDRFFSTSSYKKLKDKLGYLFKLCDAELGTNFYDQLETLAEKEAKEWELKNSSKEDHKKEEKEQKTSSSKQETKETTKETEINPEVKKFFESLPYWKNLSKKEQYLLLVSVPTLKDGVPQYKRGLKVLACSNETCMWTGTDVPSEYNEEITRCPVCDTVFPTEQ